MHVLRCLHFPFPWASPAGLAPSCTAGGDAVGLLLDACAPSAAATPRETGAFHRQVPPCCQWFREPRSLMVAFACLFSGVLVPRQAGQRGDKGIRLPFPTFFSLLPECVPCVTTWNSLSTLVPEEQ